MRGGSELGRVRGLGSAKEGAHHWWRQRVTAFGNLFLILWLTTVEVAMCTLAVGMDIKNLKLGLMDHDRSAASRALCVANSPCGA